MSMAKRIKAKRTECGLTQEELALKLGLQKSAIAKYENGRVSNIKRTTVLKMAELFDCDPSWLMGFDGDATEQDELDEYLADPDIRRLVLFAGGNIPRDERQKVVDAIIFTIQAMNKKES